MQASYSHSVAPPTKHIYRNNTVPHGSAKTLSCSYRQLTWSLFSGDIPTHIYRHAESCDFLHQRYALALLPTKLCGCLHAANQYRCFLLTVNSHLSYSSLSAWLWKSSTSPRVASHGQTVASLFLLTVDIWPCSSATCLQNWLFCSVSSSNCSRISHGSP